MSQPNVPRRLEGPDPPLYPPRLSHRQAVAWVISGLTDKPADPDLGRSPLDTKMRRLVEQEIPDREHREQLKAWCRSQMDEGAFRDICRRRGWNRTSAQRHVDLALAHLFLVMIHQTRSGRLSDLEVPDRALTTVPI